MMLSIAGLSAPVDMFAQAAGSVSGRVVDAGNNAVAGAEVSLFAAAAGRPSGSAVQVVAADARGAWSFPGVAPGEYVVRVAGGSWVVNMVVAVPAGGRAVEAPVAVLPVEVGDAPATRRRQAASASRAPPFGVLGGNPLGGGNPAVRQQAGSGPLATLGGGSAAVGGIVLAGIAAAAVVGIMAATDTGPFKDDES